MAPTLLVLALAVALFLWALYPLFGEAEPIPQERPAEALQAAVDKSIRELETDLSLQKIEREDLDLIQEHLKKESAS
jgi:hypothetical protein